jgi:hypothetical protein
MARIRLINRWVWSAFETHLMPDGSEIRKAIVSDYSSVGDRVRIPLILEPESLCCVEFLPEQFLAALQDHRLQILESVHSSNPNPTVVTKQMADLGIQSGMTTHDVLMQMFIQLNEPGYIPDI